MAASVEAAPGVAPPEKTPGAAAAVRRTRRRGVVVPGLPAVSGVAGIFHVAHSGSLELIACGFEGMVPVAAPFGFTPRLIR